jgi:membrane-bound lytic murein transglycosylase D
MTRLRNTVIICVILPAALFVILATDAVKEELGVRTRLLTMYYLSKQLAAEVAFANSRDPQELPPNYGRILDDYCPILDSSAFQELVSISGHFPESSFSKALVARFMLWMKNLPGDFFSVDPLNQLAVTLNLLEKMQRLNDLEREKSVLKHALNCLYQNPQEPGTCWQTARKIPEKVLRGGLSFCGEKIPLKRPDVSKRIEYQIAYLLTDLRSTTTIWLTRRDRYTQAIDDILRVEQVPSEFTLLPALESGYNRRVVSPSMAGGWWQFVKPTAMQSLSKVPDLDWSLQINSFKDERRDLAVSTRSAARYLKWMRQRLGRGDQPGSWLTAAAAYNAGFSEIKHRTTAYNSLEFWDMKLPVETEEYVPRWIALYLIDRNRDFYEIEVPEIQPIQFDTIEGLRFSQDLPLAHLAVLTQTSVRFLREINGSLTRDQNSFRAMRNNEPLTHTIHVPKGTKDEVMWMLKTKMYLRD